MWPVNKWSVRVVFHYGALLSVWFLIRIVSFKGGLSSEWSLIRAVSLQGGLSSVCLSSELSPIRWFSGCYILKWSLFRWSLLRVVSHYGGL